MQLNTLCPIKASQKKRCKRVGRGMGSGLGKTCGRGHKGQKSRSGGNVKPGFEGGQQPLQRRLPKYGFTSRTALFTAEVRLQELNNIPDGVVDLASLKAANLISKSIKKVKVILFGELIKPVTIKGLGITKGARAAVETVGGTIED